MSPPGTRLNRLALVLGLPLAGLGAPSTGAPSGCEEGPGCRAAAAATTGAPQKRAYYNCQANVANWENDWSGDKKTWCCKTWQLGCPSMDTPPPKRTFDCKDGYDYSGWPASKRDFCCQSAGLACTPMPNDSQWGNQRLRAQAQHQGGRIGLYVALCSIVALGAASFVAATYALGRPRCGLGPAVREVQARSASNAGLEGPLTREDSAVQLE